MIKEEIARTSDSRFSAKRLGIPCDVPAFFVVTKPTPNSRIEDIVFEADPTSLINQLRGGLKYEEIALITTDQQKAMELATKVLSKKV